MHCEVLRGSSYNATWHFHPEIQLTLVLKSNGYRLVGDNISPLHAGDLVLVGTNLPHVWQQDERKGSRNTVHAIIVRFLPSFLGPGFLEIPEAEALARLFEKAKRGLEVHGATRHSVMEMMKELPRLKGLQRIAMLLTILQQLADSKTLKPLASAGFVPDLAITSQRRLERVLTFLHENLDGHIDRDAAARRAHLSPTAFSRFFKRRTGKTLPEYLNEARIGRACRMLADEQTKVVDIAMQCGFGSLANFNRRFLVITGLNPRDYRSRLETATGRKPTHARRTRR